MKYNNDSKISNMEDVQVFFRYLVFDKGLFIHPFFPFELYKNKTDESPLFTPEESTCLNRLMKDCILVAVEEDVDLLHYMGDLMVEKKDPEMLSSAIVLNSLYEIRMEELEKEISSIFKDISSKLVTINTSRRD